MKVNRSNRKGTRDLTWKTQPMRKGKTTGASQQELQYIKSRVTTPCGGLQEDCRQGETLIAPAQASGDGPPLRSVTSRPFLCN
jgi:hypothetical protein